MQKILSFFLFTLLLTALIAFSGQNMNAALAQDETNTPSPSPILEIADQTIYATRQLGDTANVFIGYVRIRLTNATNNPKGLLIQFLPDDLKMTDNQKNVVVISRENIKFADITLNNNESRDVKVTISNVVKPGNYESNVTLRLPDQTIKEAAKVAIHLTVDAVPQLATPERVTLKVVDCRRWWGVDCWIAQWLLNAAILDNTLYFRLENLGDVPALLDADNSTVVLSNQDTHIIVNANDFGWCSNTATSAAIPPKVTLTPGSTQPPTPEQTSEATEAANEKVTACASQQIIPRHLPGVIGVRLLGSDLAPGQYNGSANLTFQGADNPVEIPIDLSIRIGPLLPAILILIGFAFSWAVATLGRPVAKLQLSLLDRLQQLAVRAADLPVEFGQEFMFKQFSTFKDKLANAKETDDKELNKQFDTLEVQTTMLLRLYTLQTSVKTATVLPQAKKDEFSQKLGDLTSRLINVDVIAVSDKEIDALSVEISLEIAKQTKQFANTKDDIAPSVSPNLSPKTWLSGVPIGSNSLEVLPRLRLFIQVAVFIISLYIGLFTQYAQGSSTFGATPNDYLLLLGWGAAANVTAEGLVAVLEKLRNGK